MKKPAPIAEMIARKAFGAPKFQQAWNVHMQAFGPILAPAYAECYTARVHLINILNKISRQDVEGAKTTMETLKRSCGCDTDEEMALWYFLEGLCGEVSGDIPAMVDGYMQAGNYHHHFYLPHLKIAKAAHQASDFDIASAEYCKALVRIREMKPGEARDKLLASALTNLASCLTYMHRYEDAMANLTEAKRTMQLPLMEVTEAILLAAMDREEEMEAILIALAEADHPAYDEILDKCSAIMHGEDPHFRPLPADENAFAPFWQWFAENEETLLRLYAENPQALNEQVSRRLRPCFPFEADVQRTIPYVHITPPEVCFFDFHNCSLTGAYAALIEACPAEIARRWEFFIET